MFASFNLGIYSLLTVRLWNNFSGTSQSKMIDVSRYLPHEEDSDLARIDSSLKLTDNLPILDGAAALVPVYASIINAVYPVGSVTYEGGKFSDDNFYGENFAEDSKMQYKNTVRGYQAIVDGTTDILFCAAPSAEQKKYAEDKGVELVYVPVGLEAFVFFVNKNNPVCAVMDDIDTDTLRKIFAGEIAYWDELDASLEHKEIVIVIRDLTGGAAEVFENQVMQGTPISENAIQTPSMGALAAKIAENEYAIGYAGFGVYNQNLDKLHAFKFNGVEPAVETILDGSYTLQRPVLFVINRDLDAAEQAFVDYIFSDTGRNIVIENGYIPAY